MNTSTENVDLDALAPPEIQDILEELVRDLWPHTWHIALAAACIGWYCATSDGSEESRRDENE